MDRSYCGSSLHVLVDFEQRHLPQQQHHQHQAQPLPRDQVRVFARFETATDAGLRRGDVVSLDMLERATQSEENPDGNWICGIREHPAQLLAASYNAVPTPDPAITDAVTKGVRCERHALCLVRR